LLSRNEILKRSKVRIVWTAKRESPNRIKFPGSESTSFLSASASIAKSYKFDRTVCRYVTVRIKDHRSRSEIATHFLTFLNHLSETQPRKGCGQFNKSSREVDTSIDTLWYNFPLFHYQGNNQFISLVLICIKNIYPCAYVHPYMRLVSVTISLSAHLCHIKILINS